MVLRKQVDFSITRRLRPHQVPHYLEKGSSKDVEGYGTQVHVEKDNTYHSNSILGQMYDMAALAEKNWFMGLDGTSLSV